MRTALLAAACLSVATAACNDEMGPEDPVDGENAALRFYGNGVNGIDRVKIRIDDPGSAAPGPPVDVGATDITIEFWIKAAPGENGAGAISCGANFSWIDGNIVLDRDRYNQDEDYGLSMGAGRLVFGVSAYGGHRTICGGTRIDDGAWHHVAITRAVTSGAMTLFVDGSVDASVASGPAGDISYPDDGVPGNFCGGPCDQSDPFIVIGAEKHDADPRFYPSFSGWIDELRFSTTIRYGGPFTVPSQRFEPDASTAALYHFDEGTGDEIGDSSGATGGPSDGVRHFGGSPAGPVWAASDAPTGGG